MQNPIRSQYWAWAALLSLGLAHPAAADTIRELSRRDVKDAGFSALVVDNSRGAVEVRRGSSGRIRIEALKLVRGFADRDRRSLAAQTTVEASVSGDRYLIRVRYPKRPTLRVSLWEGFHTGRAARIEVRLAIEVPASLPVEITSASGDLATSGLAGRQMVRSASGEVSIELAQGPVEARSTSGDVLATEVRTARIGSVSGTVRVEGCRGSLHVETTSGEVAIRNAADSIEVSTVSGDVEVAEAPRGISMRSTSGDVQVGRAGGRVRLTSASGDVRLSATTALAGARITASSGDVTAVLPRGLGCTVEASSSSGSIDLDVPAETRRFTRGRLAAVIGDGRVGLDLRTSSGDITITRGD